MRRPFAWESCYTMAESSPGKSDIIRSITTTDVRGWLPGIVEVSASPGDALPSGTWQLSIGMLHEGTPICLAIEGRDPSGWYPVSSITVEQGAAAKWATAILRTVLPGT